MHQRCYLTSIRIKSLPIIPRNDRPQHELHNIQPHPHRKKSPNSDLHPTIQLALHPHTHPKTPHPPLTSKQYPNSNISPSPSLVKSPCCLLLPGNPFTPGPSSLPTRKNAAVATSNETARKWTKTKSRVRRMVVETEVV